MCSPVRARAAAYGTHTRLAAAWRAGHAYQVGVLEALDGLVIASALDVPTRAHGQLREPGGTLLAVARRPGDWLLRWQPDGRPLAWRWIEPRRAFSGHVLASADGRTLYTTETDLDTGAGLVGVRDAASLEKCAEWPTQGIDPHQLIRDARRPGCLIVANGGVPTRPETGRLKLDLERMDSSLVALDEGSGEVRRQWRLGDPRLSLRHLAWGRTARGPVLGIALQAEHDAAVERASAPVLALFDGVHVLAVPPARPLSGYGGDIAFLDGMFAVGCPRAQGTALFGAAGEGQDFIPLEESCSIATTPGRIWAGGRHAALAASSGPDASRDLLSLPDIRLDNHWIVL